jgi:hypothetical protein
MLLCISLLIAFGMGFSTCWILRSPFHPLRRELPLLAFLSVGLGLGASSLWFFLWLVIFGGHRDALITSEICILAILVGLAYARARRSKPLFSQPIQEPRSRWRCLLVAPVVIALVAAAVAFSRYSAAAPHGSWDAWGAWNLRARFLYLGGTHWRDVFSPLGTMPHRDYPLLLSATVARCWTYLQSDSPRAPIAIAFLFTFATAGALFCSLALLRSCSQGLIAALILLATPFFLVLGSAQYADLPLSFFFLSTIVLLCWHGHSPTPKGTLSLAGAMAGLAVWTKNEGALFLLCLLLSHFAFTVRVRGWKSYRHELLPLVAGLLPVLVVVAFFKLHFAWHTEFVDTYGLFHRLRDFPRYKTVVSAIGSGLLHFGAWPLSIPPFLIAYVLLLGLQKQANRLAANIGLATVALTALGYFFVYVTTQLPLQWLLLTSLPRLCIQLYPSAIFLIFFLSRTPEEALGGSSNPGEKDRNHAGVRALVQYTACPKQSPKSR